MGQLAGGIYIYRDDVPSSPVHDVVGQVVHGIELVKLAKEQESLAVSVLPQRIDLLGLPSLKQRRLPQRREFQSMLIRKRGEDCRFTGSG